MRLNLAKNRSFCGGVNRAFQMVEKKFTPDNKKNRTYILGSLAHNESVAEKVASWHIEKISDLRKIKKGDRVIITAHGTTNETIEKIKKAGGVIFDTTCPNVVKVQKLAEKNHKNGATVFIFGDPDHKEVVGINSRCANKAVIISNLKQAERLIKKAEKDGISKIFLLSQTTQNIVVFKKVVDFIGEYSVKNSIQFEWADTICRASHIRQTEAKKMAAKNDAMIIIGGKDSANTKRLWQISKQINPKAYWISRITKRDLRILAKKIEKLKSVGIVTGASTPVWEIKQSVEYINQTVDE